MNNYPKFKTICIIAISLVIIFSCAYFKTLKEGLTNNDNIILIGDSILNNANYVPIGKSVVDILKTKTSKVLNVSKDDSTIVDLYGQLDKIPIDLNTPQTFIFVSVGGNDILQYAQKTQLNSNDIKQLFDKYMNFIKALRTKLGNTKINIMNLYLPANPRYQEYKSLIEEWNNLININSNKIGEMYNVIDIYSLLTNPNDFVNNIEPSELGSVKIANMIYLTR